MKKIEINKDMTTAEVLNYRKNAKEVFMGFGMSCFFCPAAQMETLEEGAQVHGVDVDLLVAELNKVD